jgi:hypothetical protein
MEELKRKDKEIAKQKEQIEDLVQRSVQESTKDKYIVQIYRLMIAPHVWKLNYLCTMTKYKQKQIKERFEGTSWELCLEYSDRPNAKTAKNEIREMLKPYSDSIEPYAVDRKIYVDCILESDFPNFRREVDDFMELK